MMTMIALLLAQAEPSARTLERYDTHDAAAPIPDYPLESEPASAPDPTPSLDVLCRGLLSPGSSLKRDGKVLEVRATAEEHARLRGLMGALLRRGRYMATIQARVIQKAKAEGEPRSERISAAEADDFLQGATVTSAPRLSVFSGQLTHLRVAQEHAYVRDYVTQVAPKGSAYAPVLGVAREGFELSARPVVADGSKGEILLEDLVVQLSKLKQRPFPKLSTPGGDVEAPEQRTSRAEVGASVLKKGEVLRVGPLREPWTGTPVWILLSCEVVDLGE